MSDKILNQCLVLDDADPLMLGRIRGTLLTDNYQDIVKSFDAPPWDEAVDAWGPRDPFIFLPLMPYFVYQTPKIGEMVQVMYMILQDNPHQYINQYYIQSNFYSPTSSSYQYFEGANKFTGTGFQLEPPVPLKNVDGSYTSRGIHAGVFPEPGDNAVLGRGSADLIVKQDELLLRAGKFKNTILEPNVIPTKNNQRGFLQLTRFGTTLKENPPKYYKNVKKKNLLVKYLIEYAVINPENNEDKFTGFVYLYQLKPDASTTSNNLRAGTKIASNLKVLVHTESFVAISKRNVVNLINSFIQRCNSKDVSRTGKQLFPSGADGSTSTEKFPIFYRPNFFMYSYIDPSTSKGKDSKSIENVSDIYKQIKLYPALSDYGYGLIWNKDKVGTPIEIKKEKVNQKVYTGKPSTYGALGSDNLFFLSHESSIPGKGKIDFSNTLYGITTEKFTNEILPKTSSMVRGDELLDFLNLIVKFLISHTHAYPFLPSYAISYEGTTTEDLEVALNEAKEKVLNKYIRIN